MKTREDLNILLLQIRNDDLTCEEETLEFVESSRLARSQISVLNTFREPNFSPSVIDEYDALFIGGSSDASVLASEAFPFVHRCYDLLRECYQRDFPVFASCFGFQLLVEAFGGKIILDIENIEMGCYAITRNEASNTDPLCHDLPERFSAISGHKERAEMLPPNAIHFGSSERCPYQFFKIKDKTIYAFQFHPELSIERFIPRITRYRENYFEDDNALKTVVDTTVGHNTNAVNDLVAKFIDRIVL